MKMIMKKIMHCSKVKNSISFLKLTSLPTCESRVVFSIIETYNSARKVSIKEMTVVFNNSILLMLKSMLSPFLGLNPFKYFRY